MDPKDPKYQPQAKAKPKNHLELNFSRKVSKLQLDFGMGRCSFGPGKNRWADQVNLTGSTLIEGTSCGRESAWKCVWK